MVDQLGNGMVLRAGGEIPTRGAEAFVPRDNH